MNVIKSKKMETNNSNQKETCVSRGFFVTLRPHNDNKFCSAEKEILLLTTFVKSLSGFKYSIIGKEMNPDKPPSPPDNNDYHYHIIIYTTTISRSRRKRTIAHQLKNLFPNNLQSNNSVDVKFLDANKAKVIAYVCKEDNYVVIGNIAQSTIDKAIKEHQPAPESQQTRIKYKTIYERRAASVKFVVDVMNRDKIKINFYTNEFMNLGTPQEFWNHINNSGFLDRFELEDLERIKRLFDNHELFSSVFPYYKPNLSIWKYSDYYVDLPNNKLLSIEDGDKLLAINNEDPVFTFTKPFSRDTPLLYYYFASQFKQPDHFMKAFREILLPVTNGGNNMHIQFPYETDNPVIVDLFSYIFRNVITPSAINTESRHPFPSIASNPKFIIHKDNLVPQLKTQNATDQLKKITNFEEVQVSKPYSHKTVLSVSKNGIISHNELPNQRIMPSIPPIFRITRSDHHNFRTSNSNTRRPELLYDEAHLIISYHIIPIRRFSDPTFVPPFTHLGLIEARDHDNRRRPSEPIPVSK